MDIGFLHIGMMKTATTYMQNIWLNDSSYCTSVKSTILFISAFKEMVTNEKLNENVNFELKFELKIDESYSANQKVVVSNVIKASFPVYRCFILLFSIGHGAKLVLPGRPATKNKINVMIYILFFNLL